MALPVEQITMYYEDSVNHYTYTQTQFNKRSAFTGTLMPPVNALFQFNVNESRTVAGDKYYWHNEASDVAGYNKLLTIPSDIGKQALVATLYTGGPVPSTQLMGKWMTEPGVPGHTGTTPAGSWITYFRQRRTIDGVDYINSFTIRWYRYYYNTDLGSWAESSQIAYTAAGASTITELTQTFSHSIISTTFGPTDRLVVKVWANFAAADPTI